MTERQHHRLERYVRRVADQLGLRDWQLELNPTLTAAAVDAKIKWGWGRRWAEITLGEAFFEQTPEERRETVVHELLHCHFGAACDAVVRNAKSATYKHFMHQLEYGIDATASAIAPGFPLPPR